MIRQQKIKGRARIYIEQQYTPKGIEYPKLGQTGFGAMEVKEYFKAFKDCIQLLAKYKIIGVFFDVPYYSWCIVVESDDIPLTTQHETIPMMSVCYEYKDGKISIANLTLI